MVICLERGADLHMAQLMPLLLTVSCFSKIQIGFTFLIPAHSGSPGQRVVKRVCVISCIACRTDTVGGVAWWFVCVGHAGELCKTAEQIVVRYKIRYEMPF